MKLGPAKLSVWNWVFPLALHFAIEITSSNYHYCQYCYHSMVPCVTLYDCQKITVLL